MTPFTRLRTALASVHWSQRRLAAVLGKDERQVRRWCSGAYTVPPGVLAWLETLAAAHDANPPPREETHR